MITRNRATVPTPTNRATPQLTFSATTAKLRVNFRILDIFTEFSRVKY